MEMIPIIERDFLIDSKSLNKHQIVLKSKVCYLSYRPEIKIEECNHKYYIVTSITNDSSEITRKRYETLLNIAISPVMSREIYYFIPATEKHSGLYVENYSELDNIVIGRIKFYSKRDADSFVPPKYCIEEITDSIGYNMQKIIDFHSKQLKLKTHN